MVVNGLTLVLLNPHYFTHLEANWNCWGNFQHQMTKIFLFMKNKPVLNWVILLTDHLQRTILSSSVRVYLVSRLIVKPYIYIYIRIWINKGWLSLPDSGADFSESSGESPVANPTDKKILTKQFILYSSCLAKEYKSYYVTAHTGRSTLTDSRVVLSQAVDGCICFTRKIQHGGDWERFRTQGS